jgi:hypothetical protein
LSEGRPENGFEDELPVFMDLVSHDVLNINQAVLSAIELMIESSQADEGAKRRARRVESQIRISTQIFESMKLLCVSHKSGKMPSDPVDLNEEVRTAVSDIRAMFKDRQVNVEFEESAEKPFVSGGSIVSDLLVNSLMGLLQLDNSEHPSIAARIARHEEEGAPWVVLLSSDNVSVPTSVGFDAIGAMTDDSRTKMVRLAGLILARVMTEKLGGTFGVASREKGTELRISLPGAG